MQRIIRIFVLLLLAAPSWSFADILLVNPSAGTPTPARLVSVAGADWTTSSYLTIQAALNAALSGDEIWIMAGAYAPTAYPAGCTGCGPNQDKTFLIPSGVSVYGGFAGTEISTAGRNFQANVTTLSGDMSGPVAYHVITVAGNAVPVILDGLTIRDGNANGAGFVTVNGLNLPQTSGGGVFVHSGSLVVRNCVLTANSAGNGGGINAFLSTLLVDNCLIEGNLAQAGGDGGGLLFDGSVTSASLINSIFTQNAAAASAGGAFISNASPCTITNCVFTQNEAFGGPGGGVWLNGSFVSTLRNCTFSQNSSSTGGRGVQVNFGTANISNSIFWNNGAQETGNASGTLNVSSSVVKGGIAPCTTCPNTNGDLDPLFLQTTDLDGGDNVWATADDGLSLKPCSPVVNAGDNTGVSSTDVTGAARISFTTADLGAYEQQTAFSPIVAGPLTGPSAFCTGAPISGNLSLTITGGTSPYTVDFSDNAGGNFQETSYLSGGNVTISPSITTLYSVTAVTDATGCGVTVTGVDHTVSIYNAPVYADVSPSATLVCAGTQVTLTFSVTGGTAPFSINFTDGTLNFNKPSAAASSTENVIPLGSPSYSVTSVTDVNGCSYNSPSSSSAVSVIPYHMYVNEFVANGGDFSGNSWVNAMSSLGEALFRAHQCPGTTEIWVAAGIYYPSYDVNLVPPSDPREKTFYLRDGLQLYGGFTGSEATIGDRPASGVESMMSGDVDVDGVSTGNVYSLVISANDNSSTLIDRFAIDGGNADGLGAVVAEGLSFGKNTGGGININQGTPHFNDCLIRSHDASLAGGAVYVFNGSPVFTGCSIYQSDAGTGGGVSVEDGSAVTAPLFERCAFYSNSSTSGMGGGIYAGPGTSPSLVNCVISGNVATAGGGGVYAGIASTPVLTNCLIQGNTTNGDGGALYQDNASVQVQNSILWGNFSYDATPTPSLFENGTSSLISYSIVQGTPVYAGVGNSNSDPKFVRVTDANGLDEKWLTADDGLRPASCSPALDAALDATAPANDGLGNSRMDIAGVGGADFADMGPYERQGINLPSLAQMSGGGTVCSGGSVTISVAITGGISPYTVEYDDEGTPRNAEYYLSGAPLTKSPAADYTYTLISVTDDEGCTAQVLTGDATATIIGSASPTLYVNAAVSGGDNSGDSWTNAIEDLSSALNIAHSCAGVTDVWVAAGEYKPTDYPQECTDCNDVRDKTFRLKEGISLYGGFTGSEALLADRPAPLAATILTGDLSGDDAGFSNRSDNAYHIVVSEGTTSATVLNGFTLKAGTADDPLNGSVTVNGTSFYRIEGGGIALQNASPTISECLFIDHMATSGGAIAASNSSYVLDSCTIQSGQASLGGGIYQLSGSPTISRTEFLSNSALIGGAMYAISVAPSFSRVVFSGNAASTGDGGAGYLQASNAAFTNCVFAGNSAGISGGGLFLSGGPGTMLNHCTFFDNGATGLGGGVYFEGGSNVLTVSNAVLWANNSVAGTNDLHGIDLAPVVTYSLTQNVYSGTGNLVADPLFTNTGNLPGSDNRWRTSDDGLTPGTGSPVINTADPLSITPLTDIAGASHTGTFDIGAYEYAVCAALGAGTRLYVDGGLASDGAGITWATAFKSLGNALFKVTECPQITEMWVKGGMTYVPSRDGFWNATPTDPRDKTFRIPAGLALYGGFAGAENSLTARTLAVQQANPTTLSGDLNGDDSGFANNTENAYHVVIGTDLPAGSRLDGFIITGGNADGTGGPAIGAHGFQRDAGGGLYVANSLLTVEGCVIMGNSSVNNGGGMRDAYSGTTLRNTIFSNNQTSGVGGALSSFGPSSVGSTTSVSHCVMTGNTAGSQGAALNLNGSDLSVSHTTLAYNTGNSPVENFSGNPAFTNCIFRGNSAIAPTISLISGTPTITYSLTDVAEAGTGNLTSDPLFANASDPDGADNRWRTADDGLRLLCGSAAAEAGTNTGASTDILGAATSGVEDMGAYEYHPFAAAPVRLYVNQAATGTQDGDSWAASFTELTTALACQLVTPSVTEIWVAGGTYKPTSGTDRTASFGLRNGLTLYGSFAGGEGSLTARTSGVMAANPSFLSGEIGSAPAADNCYHVVTASGNDATAVLNGFTVQGGNADGSGTAAKGGGLLSDNAAPLIALCTFSGNSATDGGGVAVLNPILAPVTLTELNQCTITGNTAAESGGGIYADKMGVTFTGTTVISGNSFGTNHCE